jgi:sugar phosphate isomerase/epimerase
MMPRTMHRRGFLENSALTLAALATARAEEKAPPAQRPLAVFTKTFEKVPAAALGEKIAALGVRAIEAPIRKGGHIEPHEVPDKLPGFVEALRSHGVTLEILTSDIGEADAGAESVLRAAAKLGIRRYRLRHYHYDLKKPIAPQLADIRAKLKDLAAMNRELGVQGQYQNHRGNNYAGGPIWDMVSALEGIDPADLGLAFDFAHATVEGTSAWELNFRRAAPHIVAVYFKDYRLDGRTWDACPLGEGIVNPQAGAMVNELLPATTPVSLHVEYVAGGGDARVSATLEAMAKDLKTLAGWLG